MHSDQRDFAHMLGGELGEPPARLSFSPPLPELDRGEPQMEGVIEGDAKRQREEWKRKETTVDE